VFVVVAVDVVVVVVAAAAVVVVVVAAAAVALLAVVVVAVVVAGEPSAGFCFAVVGAVCGKPSACFRIAAFVVFVAVAVAVTFPGRVAFSGKFVSIGPRRSRLEREDRLSSLEISTQHNL